jgi:hypothetical protein
MTLQDVMHTIEGHQFAAEANIASGSKAFHNGLRSHHIFGELMEYMKEPNVREVILNRLIELSKKPVQPYFENPFDTALTTYLTALDLQSPELVRHGAEAVSKAPSCWWANEMSLRVLARREPGQMTIAIFESAINAKIPGRMARLAATQAATVGVMAATHYGSSSFGIVSTSNGSTAPLLASTARAGRRGLNGPRRRGHRRSAAA